MSTIPAPSEALENGARSTTPAGDNVLLDFARAEAAAYSHLARAAGGRVEHDDELGLAMTDTGSPCPFGNVAHLTRPIGAAETPGVAAALRRFYGARTGGEFLVFSPWPTEDWSAEGFVLGGHPPVMLRPAGPPPDDSEAALRIVEVTTTAELDDFERTMIDAYPLPEIAPFGSHPRVFAEPLIGSPWRMFVAYDHDATPVATSAAYVTDQLVAIEMVSTRPEHRGRGVGRAITAAAGAVASDRPAVLIASDLGQGVYRRLGYQPILRYTLWLGRR